MLSLAKENNPKKRVQMLERMRNTIDERLVTIFDSEAETTIESEMDLYTSDQTEQDAMTLNFENVFSLGTPFLIGPIRWTYVNYHGIKFYMFGDRHDDIQRGMCPFEMSDSMDVKFLIKDLIETSAKKQINSDLYLEIPFVPKTVEVEPEHKRVKQMKQLDPFIHPMYLTDIRKMFSDCFTSQQKKRCPYHPYVHFHYIDIRQLQPYYHDLFPPSLTFINYVLHDRIRASTSMINLFVDKVKNNESSENIKQLDHVKEYLNTTHHFVSKLLSEGYYSKFFKCYTRASKFKECHTILLNEVNASKKDPDGIKRLLQTIMDNKMIKDNQYRIAVQLNALSGTKEFDYLNDYVRYLLDTKIAFLSDRLYQIWNTIYQKFIEYLKLVKDKKKNLEQIKFLNESWFSKGNLNQLWETFENLSVTMESIFMDVYTLARMFRFQQQHKSKMKIIYAGAEHIKTYASFFEFLNKTKKENVFIYTRDKPLTNKFYRCIAAPHFEVSDYF